MIPTFKRVIKCKHCIYTHEEIDDLIAYLTSADLPRGAITKICRDTGIPERTLRDWHAS
jgi:predicted RNA binding protein YcfA (HicA-like mRNA interferase family)